MNFKECIKLSENVQISAINPEEDWEEAEQAEMIARQVRINTGRKDPVFVAKNDQGEVIGAVFANWSEDQDASQQAGFPVALWDFDVVVRPEYQGYHMVGMQLIRRAEQERKNLEALYDRKAYTRLWVVNPRLAKVLQSRRYGYDSESEYEDGSAHLVKHN
jgi:hypothetical protein